MEALKPCLFCPSTNTEIRFEHGESFVTCLECGGSGPAFDYDRDGPSRAAKAWNTRPVEDAFQARIDALVELVKALEREREHWNDLVDTCHIKGTMSLPPEFENHALRVLIQVGRNMNGVTTSEFTKCRALGLEV